MKLQLFITTLLLILFSGCTNHLNFFSGSSDSDKGSLTESVRLPDDYYKCLIGNNQSFVNINNIQQSKSRALTFKYVKGADTIINNGNTIQINIKDGNYLSVDKHKYELKQLHFFSFQVSRIFEHHFPLEAHFVHADKSGHLVVVAVMFEPATTFNPEIDAVWKNIPLQPDDSNSINFSADDLKNLLPQKKTAYRFDAPLSATPCTDNVKWIILKQPIEITPSQIKHFKQVMHEPDVLPTLPYNQEQSDTL